MINLSTCLQSQIGTIGNDCENIGKTEGRGLFSKKVMLAYERDKGWQCVKLNLPQLFLRKAFGLYHSTHLDTVARATNRTLDKSSEPLVSKFDSKIHDIWSKSYKKPFPKEIYFDPDNHSLIQSVYEEKRSVNHINIKLNDICNLVEEDKEISIENIAFFDEKVQELLQDLPSCFMFLPKNQRPNEDRVTRVKDFIFDYSVKLKNKEITRAEFKYVVYAIILKALNVTEEKRA